jgi:hypothetical protein
MNDHNPQVEVPDDQAAPVLHDVRHARFRLTKPQIGAAAEAAASLLSASSILRRLSLSFFKTSSSGVSLLDISFTPCAI